MNARIPNGTNDNRSIFLTRAGWASVAVALIGVVGNYVQTSKISADSVAPLESGQKLCTIAESGRWSDGIIVPKSWLVTTCREYADKSKASIYAVGCVRPGHVGIGKFQTLENLAVPPDGDLNCGW